MIPNDRPVQCLDMRCRLSGRDETRYGSSRFIFDVLDIRRQHAKALGRNEGD